MGQVCHLLGQIFIIAVRCRAQGTGKEPVSKPDDNCAGKEAVPKPDSFVGKEPVPKPDKLDKRR